MKVGEKYKDSGKIVVITMIERGLCWYKPVERWDSGSLDSIWHCGEEVFEQYVDSGCYILVPGKSDNFNTLYDKLRGQ